MADKDILVDLDAMTELANQLRAIKTDLQAVQTEVGGAGGFGSDRVQDAVDDFVGGWRDGRKKIIEAVDRLIGSVEGSIDAYRQNERRLVEATRGGRAGRKP